MELYDDANEFSTVDNDFTAATAGDYEVCASLTSIPASSTLSFELDVFIDGVRERAFAGGGAGFQQGCHVVRLTAGQVVAVEIYQQSGAPVAFGSNSIWNWLTIRKVVSHAAMSDVSAFSVPVAAFTKAPFATKLYDDDNELSTVNHNFTAATAGDYEVCASMTSIPASATLNWEMDLFIDGVRERAFAGGGEGFQQGCRIVRLNAGQVVDVDVYQIASTIGFSPNGLWNWLTVNKVTSHVGVGDAASFAAPTGVFTQIPYSAKLYDDSSEYSTVNHDFTAAVGGDYEVCASLTSLPASLTLDFELDLFVDGVRERAFAGGQQGFQQGCRVVRLTAGQTVAVELYHQAGSTITFSPNLYWNWLTITKKG